MQVYLVIVDNEDTELEVWAFASFELAARFADIHGGEVESYPLLSGTDAEHAISALA